MVVVLQQRNREPRHGVLFEIGRHVADAQPAFGRAIVAVWLGLGREWSRMPGIPHSCLGKEVARADIRPKLHVEQQNAVSMGASGRNLTASRCTAWSSSWRPVSSSAVSR